MCFNGGFFYRKTFLFDKGCFAGNIIVRGLFHIGEFSPYSVEEFIQNTIYVHFEQTLQQIMRSGRTGAI